MSQVTKPNNRFLSQVIGNNANYERGVRCEDELAKQEMKPVLTVIGNEVMFTKTGYGVKIVEVAKWKDERLKIYESQIMKDLWKWKFTAMLLKHRLSLYG